MAADPNRDRMTVHYVLPLSGSGMVELLIETRSSGLSGSDSGFLLEVLEKVNEFARAVHPAPAAPEVPSALRGVSTQNRGQRA
jgi:hypothetical protein